MSQYPSPYSPPPYPQNLGYYAPYGVDPLRAAKRAGLLMIVLGAVGVILSLCIVGVRQILMTTALPSDLSSQLQQMEAQSGISASTVFAILSGIFLVAAAFEIFIGVIVRTGRKVSIILALIGTSIVLLLLGLLVSIGVLAGLARGDPKALLGIFFWSVPLALLVLQLIWLISAVRASQQTAIAMQQYHAQYWQYQQNMQAHGGYGQAPPPPAGKSDEVTG